MKRSQFIAALFFALTSTIACQAEDNKKPWWDFMAVDVSESTSPVQGHTASSSKSSAKSDEGFFKFPSMPTMTSKGSKKKSNKPSMISRAGSATKEAWDSTLDFVNPFNDGDNAPKSKSYSNTTKSSKSGEGMFGWMYREEKTESPATVNEFLKQDRPQF